LPSDVRIAVMPILRAPVDAEEGPRGRVRG
jgi:hypothetical protein